MTMTMTMTLPSPIRAVVFDLDGLMFDTEALFASVAVELLAARGKTFTPEMMRAMIGRRAAEAYPALKALAGLEESADDLLAEVRARFTELMDTAVHPAPGLFALLAHLGARSFPFGVATSSRRVYADSRSEEIRVRGVNPLDLRRVWTRIAAASCTAS